jgi:subtilisin family serine protease
MLNMIRTIFLTLFSLNINADSIIIAIIDSGIDKSKFSKELFLYDPRFNCPLALNLDSNNVCEKQDQEFLLNQEYHGTLVAQIIARKNPYIKIADYIYADIYNSIYQLNLRRFPENGKQVWERTQIYKRIESNLIASIMHARDVGSRIINISSGDSFFKSIELFNLIKTSADLLFIVSSGNEGKELKDHNKVYPCSFNLPNLICVGAIDKNLKITDYSNYGSDVTFFVKEDPKHPGTSFVTPKVTKLASLILQKNNNLSAFDLKYILLKKSKKINQINILDTSFLPKQ